MTPKTIAASGYSKLAICSQDQVLRKHQRRKHWIQWVWRKEECRKGRVPKRGIPRQ